MSGHHRSRRLGVERREGLDRHIVAPCSPAADPERRRRRHTEEVGLITGKIDEDRGGPAWAWQSASAAATTDVPTPPLGDRQITNTTSLPEQGLDREVASRP
jgi:hypothetical protein